MRVSYTDTATAIVAMRATRVRRAGETSVNAMASESGARAG